MPWTTQESDPPAPDTEGAENAPAILSRNKVGQRMRTKGHGTRRRIIDQTMLLLRDSPSGDVSASDVARACGLTPPALYLYFSGVPDVVLARLEEIDELPHRHLELLEEPWRKDQMFEQAREFVHAYADYWQTYGTPLRYRNIMSQRGDPSFMRMRVKMTRPIADRIAFHIRETQKLGRIPEHLHPPSAAGAALALVDHAASVASFPYGSLDWERESFLEAAAYMVTSLIQDQP